MSMALSLKCVIYSLRSLLLLPWSLLSALTIVIVDWDLIWSCEWWKLGQSLSLNICVHLCVIYMFFVGKVIVVYCYLRHEFRNQCTKCVHDCFK